MSISKLKAKARNDLKGKYEETIIMLLVYFAISRVSNYVLANLNELIGISKVSTLMVEYVLSLALSGIFGYGITSYYLKVSRGEEVTFKELFSKTNFALPYIFLSVVTGIFIFLWSLLFIIPGIIAAISYSLVHFIKLDNPELNEFEVIRRSKEMMKGHKMDYLILCLSFIGWEILGVFTFGILYVWLIPYINVTMANFYNQLKQEKITF